MPVIELKVSDKVFLRWQRFLASQQAGRLIEADLLGDWVAQGFLNQVNDYLKLGGPAEPEDEHARRQRLDAEARRHLSKAQKRVLPMFNENETITAAEISRVLGLDSKEGAALAEEWLAQDFLTPAPERDGQPTYTLSRSWQERNLAANRPSLNAPRNLYFNPLSKPGPNRS
ncbi:MAG: hypothetical protein AB1814_08285 [Thermodesulfobacteriota bacterium]